MSKSIKILAAVSFMAALSACGSSGQSDEEFVVVEPVSTEPVYTGKYK
jgi:hypothetical protein